MSFANKHNTASRLFTFDIPENFEYRNLSQMVNEYGIEVVHTVNALYVNKKSKYGDSPVIATNNELVNAPQHMLSTIKDVMIDGESLSLINNGYVGFKVYEYQNEHGTNYALEWVDIEPAKPAAKPATRTARKSLKDEDEAIPF